MKRMVDKILDLLKNEYGIYDLNCCEDNVFEVVDLYEYDIEKYVEMKNILEEAIEKLDDEMSVKKKEFKHILKEKFLKGDYEKINNMG